MNYGVEILVADRGQYLQPYAVIFELAGRDVVGAAIDSNVVATRDQSGGKMFGKSFKSTVAGRHSPCSENGYSHRNWKRRFSVGLSSRS